MTDSCGTSSEPTCRHRRASGSIASIGSTSTSHSDVTHTLSVTGPDENGNEVSKSLSLGRSFKRFATDPASPPHSSPFSSPRRRTRYTDSKFQSNQSLQSSCSRSPKRDRRADSFDGKQKDTTELEARSLHAFQSAIAGVMGGTGSKFNELLACLAEEHERDLTQAMSALLAENVRLTGELRQARHLLQNLNTLLTPNQQQALPGDKLASDSLESLEEKGPEENLEIESSVATERARSEIQEDRISFYSGGSRLNHGLPSLLTSRRDSFKSEEPLSPESDESRPCPPETESKSTSPKERRRKSLLQVPISRKSSVSMMDRKLNAEPTGSSRNPLMAALQQLPHHEYLGRVDSFSSLTNAQASPAFPNVSGLTSTMFNVPIVKRDSVTTVSSSMSRPLKYDDNWECHSVDLPGSPSSRRNSFKHVTVGCPRELPHLRDVVGSASWRNAVAQRVGCSARLPQDGGYVSEVDVPNNPDESITILNYWRATTHRASLRLSEANTATSSRSLRLKLDEHEGSLDQTVSWLQGLAKRLVIRPGSHKQIAWDISGMFLMLYDLVTIPLLIFDLPEDTFTSTVSVLSSIFWTIDIPFSFLCGFNFEGVAELRLDQIARHYARTWLAFDVVIVSVDWFIHLLDTVIPDRLPGRSLNALRLLRLARLLKLRGLVNDIIERVRSEFTLVMIGIARVILSIMLLNHVIACTWYGIGVWYDEGDGQNTWVQQYNLSERELGYRYFTALHWSLTQFTPASMEIMPTNTLERVFAVLVLLFAMLTFSSLVSSITNAMTQLRNLNSEKLEQMSMLRRYLGENKASNLIMGRIWGCLDQVVDKSKRRLHQKDVAILSLLPSKLKGDLLEEVYSPIVAVHPFWKQLAQNLPVECKRICQNAIEEKSITIGHEVFNAGEEAHHMFFILNGMLTYKLEQSAAGQPSVIVTTGSWASEAALWIEWKHAGQLATTTHCEVLAIAPAGLSAAIAEAREPAKYASLFAEYFTDNPDKLSDIWCDIENLQDLSTKAFDEDELADGLGYSDKTLSEVMMGVVPVLNSRGSAGRRSSVSRLWSAFTPFTKFWQPDECLEGVESSQSDGDSSEKSSSSSSQESSHSKAGSQPDADLGNYHQKRYPPRLPKSVKDGQGDDDGLSELSPKEKNKKRLSPIVSHPLQMCDSDSSERDPSSPKESLPDANKDDKNRAW